VVEFAERYVYTLSQRLRYQVVLGQQRQSLPCVFGLYLERGLSVAQSIQAPIERAW
jgi:hypothetical protein